EPERHGDAAGAGGLGRNAQDDPKLSTGELPRRGEPQADGSPRAPCAPGFGAIEILGKQRERVRAVEVDAGAVPGWNLVVEDLRQMGLDRARIASHARVVEMHSI